MELLNRIALVVTPKRRFLEWVNGLPEVHRTLKAAELPSLRRVYLAAVGDIPPPLEELIDTYWEEIFEASLEDWIPDESRWPANRTPHMFRDWFQVEQIEGVEDVDPGEPMTIRELARTRCAACDADLTADAIAVVTFPDRRFGRMTIPQLETLVGSEETADDPNHPVLVFRCCREECAQKVEAGLEQARTE